MCAYSSCATNLCYLLVQILDKPDGSGLVGMQTTEWGNIVIFFSKTVRYFSTIFCGNVRDEMSFWLYFL